MIQIIYKLEKANIKRGFKVFITVGIMVLIIFPLPIKMNKTITAVEIALDEHSFCRPTVVTVNGTYKWRLVGSDSFVGNISFDNYDLTMENVLVQTDNIPALKQQDGGDFLEYGEWMDSQVFGYISWKPFLSKFVVQVYVPYESTDGKGEHWSTIDGHCIVGKAINRDEALELLKGFSNIHLPPYEYWVE